MKWLRWLILAGVIAIPVYFQQAIEVSAGLTSTVVITFTPSNLPNAPTSFIVIQTNIDEGTGTWVTGAGATETLIRVKVGEYPATVTDGWEAYNGAGLTFVKDGLLFDQYGYYWRAWSHNPAGYSLTYAEGTLGGANMALLASNAGMLVFILMALALTWIGSKTTYWILRAMAGVAWFAVLAYWLSNRPSTVTAGSPTDQIVVLLFIGLGLAVFYMMFWYNRNENGVETGTVRLPFMNNDDDVKERTAPTRSERMSTYRQRANDAMNGRRQSRR